jgi:hypothetical protein
MEMRPNIIAVTENDPRIEEKKVQAKKMGGELRVIPFMKSYSTSRLAKILGVE